VSEIAKWLRRAADNGHSFSIGTSHTDRLRDAADEIERLVFQNKGLLEMNAKERSHNTGWATKWNDAMCEVDRLRAEVERLQNKLRTIYTCANEETDALTIGTNMHNIWLICREGKNNEPHI
jgi:hypothetical protein